MNSLATPPTARGIDQIIQLGRARPLDPNCGSFYFLRHGQTACNARRIFQAVDEPLNATGLQQAQQAAHLLAAEPLARIVCSDARRAFDTARAVAAPHGFAPEPHAGLRERNFGELIGTSSATIDWTCAPAGGETLAAFMQRSHAIFARMLALSGPVLIVAHGGTLYALAAMLGISIDLGTLGNALPLRFAQAAHEATGWTITSLRAPSTDHEAALA